jgi:PAS domain S-box-containing protein
MSIIEGSPNFVFYINMDHVIKYMNPAVFTISGYTKEEFFTYGLGLILNGEDLHRLHEEYLPAVIKQRHLSFEMNITCKNGEKRIFQFSAFAANLYSGEVGVGLTVSDITKLVRMQQDLIKAKENAERAMLEAQYYNRAKSNFLSRMSHEMRTPMNAIINLADLTRTSNARRRDHYLEEIGEAARLLMGIINNILDMMEIENGTFALVPKLFSLPDMLQRVTEKTRRYAEKKKQQFAVDFGGELPGMVVADEERLEQALYNLLNNAVKFTPEQGAIAFSVRTLKEDDIRYELYFEVRDTGIGVSPGQQDRLWQVFEQGDNSISRQYGGTGLGLSIVKGIVTLMDGSIRLESEPGKGSQFIFTVRLDKFFEQAAVSEAAGKSRSRDFPDGSAGVPGNFAGKRVLLADDMEVNRDIILALLEGTGILVDCAADGSNALEIFTANSGAYDLLLMDLHMPLMDGFEAARHIRRSGIPNADTVPIIAVTADTGSDVVAQCLEAGMNGHISKPVALEALFETLGRYLPGQ